MAQFWKLRLPNGNILTPGDWTAAEPLWSTVEIGPGAFQVLRAFSYTKGSSVPGSVGPRLALPIDTNLQGEGSRLKENEELICYNIGISVFKRGPAADVDAFPDADDPNVPLPDMLRLQRDVLVEFKIANVKDYTHSPVSYWPAGMGVPRHDAGGRSFVSAGAPTGEVIAYNGGVNRGDMRALGSPLYVQGGESLYVDLRPATGQVQGLNLAADSRLVLRIYLDGYRRRPVA